MEFCYYIITFISYWFGLVPRTFLKKCCTVLLVSSTTFIFVNTRTEKYTQFPVFGRLFPFLLIDFFIVEKTIPHFSFTFPHLGSKPNFIMFYRSSVFATSLWDLHSHFKENKTAQNALNKIITCFQVC